MPIHYALFENNVTSDPSGSGQNAGTGNRGSGTGNRGKG